MIFRDLTTNRCRFLCLGPDATRYLNGQVSQDVRLVAEGRALPACLTNAKGRLESELMIAPHPEGFRIDGPAALRDFLALRLEKYLIADDCQIEDVTESSVQFFLHGEGEVAPLKPPMAWPSARFGLAGWDLWAGSEEAGGLEARLASVAGRESDEAAEDARIRRGIPAWGSELDADTLPPEAGLEASHISYTKGCYIGQEVISRLKSVGQVTRRLCLLRPMGEETLSVGWELHATPTPDARPLGRITSVTRDGLCGLAFVRRPHHAPGTHLSALPNGQSSLSISVEILAPVESQSPVSLKP